MALQKPTLSKIISRSSACFPWVGGVSSLLIKHVGSYAVGAVRPLPCAHRSNLRLSPQVIGHTKGV